MDLLSNTIYRYYFKHLTQLTPEKKFHLASRLYLYNQDSGAKELLTELQPYFTYNNQPELAVHEIVAEALSKPSHGSKNASALRQPYFEKYPQLKIYLVALFRINWLQSAYQIDSKTELFKLFSKQEMEQQKEQLLNDPEAIAILSTHAINFLYLYERLIKEDDQSLPVEQFYTIGQNNYDLDNPLHIQLLIYLYTHCIIGESKFYARLIPDHEKQSYTAMLDYLEELISSRYDMINLDNKFEFLVCAKMLNYSSQLTGRILEEAEASVSENGDFLIDRHNKNPQTSNTDLDSSEHRNVLFIMSGTDFKPLNH